MSDWWFCAWMMYHVQYTCLLAVCVIISQQFELTYLSYTFTIIKSLQIQLLCLNFILIYQTLKEGHIEIAYVPKQRSFSFLLNFILFDTCSHWPCYKKYLKKIHRIHQKLHNLNYMYIKILLSLCKITYNTSQIKKPKLHFKFYYEIN